MDAGLDNAVTVDLAAGTANVNYLFSFDDDYLIYNVENVIGGGNDDSISGSFATNVLAGGFGEDTLSGDDGDDYFVMTYEAGSIIDTVTDEITDFKVGGDADKIVLDGFGGVTKISDLLGRSTQFGTDVVIAFDNYYEIVVRNITIAALIDPTNFASSADLPQGAANALAGGGASLVIDDINGNVVDGTAVGNVIGTAYIDAQGDSVTASNDIIIGGLGDDAMYGGVGDDAYIFNYNTSTNTGDGADTIQEAGSGNDSINININSDQIFITRGTSGSAYSSYSAYHLYVRYGANGDKITIKYQFHPDTQYQVENVNGINLLGGLPIRGVDGAAESLNATDFADTITGGDMNDVLYGKGGNDDYEFKIGDGVDTIQEAGVANGGNDSINIEGVTSSDIFITRGVSSSAYNLYIRYGTNGDSITVNYQFHPNTEYQVEEVNGINLLGGLPIRGIDNASEILNATDFDDTITGGNMNDTLYGKGGNDNYEFKVGDGADTIQEAGVANGGNDSINIEGVTSNNIYFNRIGNHLYINYGENGGEGSITINYQFLTSNTEYQVESINGINLLGGLTFKEIDASSQTLSGTDQNDTFLGGDGSDNLYGGLGDDTYYFESGNGFDVISDNLGSNTLIVGAGWSDWNTVNTDDLQVLYKDANDAVTDSLYVNDYFLTGGAWG